MGTFLTAEWRYLAMLNYEVDSALLEPLCPIGTELESFEGKYFASPVAFRFLDTRVIGVPIPFHRNFEEINLRFYVRRKAPDGWRRGVVFVREIVPRAAIALVARVLYGENYVAMPTRHSFVPAPLTLTYEWKDRSRWNKLSLDARSEPRLAAEGSHEEFITEHYWGYTKRRSETTEYKVAHPKWRIWHECSANLDCDLQELYGSDFAAALSAPPSSVFLAEGSEISVSSGTKLEAYRST